LIVAMGAIAAEAAAAAEALSGQGVSVKVVVAASINPAPVDDLATLLAAFPVVLTVEAHYLTGGIGSLVSGVVAAERKGCRVIRCGVSTVPRGPSGSQEFLHHTYGLSREALADIAVQALRNARMS